MARGNSYFDKIDSFYLSNATRVLENPTTSASDINQQNTNGDEND